MNRPRRNRYLAASLLPAAVGLLVAVGALAGPAVAKDGNRDRIPDRWEKRHHLSLKVDQSRRDQDGDNLRNRAEFLAGDDPRDRDSDDDGVMDGEENAGTIQSFDAATSKLTIALFGGDTVSGLVTEDTRIKCGDEGSSDAAQASRDGEESGDDRGDGDNSGPGPSGDNGAGANCTTSNLIVGAVIEEAGLELEHGVATFDEVELAG